MLGPLVLLCAHAFAGNNKVPGPPANVFTAAVDRAAAIPAEAATLPEQLKPQGYSTHMVGKWHLGFASTKSTPTGRGFDTFLGMLNGASDYYNASFPTCMDPADLIPALARSAGSMQVGNEAL